MSRVCAAAPASARGASAPDGLVVDQHVRASASRRSTSGAAATARPVATTRETTPTALSTSSRVNARARWFEHHVRTGDRCLKSAGPTSARAALPHTLCELDASTGPVSDGMTDCGSIWPKCCWRSRGSTATPNRLGTRRATVTPAVVAATCPPRRHERRIVIGGAWMARSA
jgi:hypothetical protein